MTSHSILHGMPVTVKLEEIQSSALAGHAGSWLYHSSLEDPMDIKELETNSQCQVALNQSVELAMLSDQACEPAGQKMCNVFRLTAI